MNFFEGVKSLMNKKSVINKINTPLSFERFYYSHRLRERLNIE